jgi:hypothetical protein
MYQNGSGVISENINNTVKEIIKLIKSLKPSFSTCVNPMTSGKNGKSGNSVKRGEIGGFGKK